MKVFEDLDIIALDDDIIEDEDVVEDVVDDILDDEGSHDAVVPEKESKSFASLLGDAYDLLFSLQTVHWNSVGTDFFCLHEKLDEYIDEIKDEIDDIGELAMEFEGVVQNPCELISCGNDKLGEYNLSVGFLKDEGFAAVQSCIVGYINAMTELYEYTVTDVQSVLDDWLRYWKKEADYKLARQQVTV